VNCFATAGVSFLTTLSTANDTITCPAAGTYQVSFFTTFADGNNVQFSYRVFNVTQNTPYVNTTATLVTRSTDRMLASFSAMIEVAAGDVLCVQIASSSSASTVTFTNANFSLNQIAQAIVAP
jgi:hypothetical protein